MSKLKLNSGSARQFPDEVCIKFMEEVDQISVQSVRFGCVTDAVHIWERFNRARKRCQARGNHRFDGLKFYIPGSSWIVVYRPAPGLSQRDAEFRAMRGRRYLVSDHDIILVWSEYDTE